MASAKSKPETIDEYLAQVNPAQQRETSKGTIRFTPEKPLPKALVKKLVKARISENLQDSRKQA